MRQKVISWVGVLAFAVACSAGNDATNSPQGNPSAQSEKAGTVSLNLIGTDSTGQQYRLRNAMFELYGWNNNGYETISSAGAGGSFYDSYHYETFSSEDSPDAARIQRRVVPGSYYITLLNSEFYLERITPEGPERVQKLVLLSNRSQYLQVWEGSTTPVAYRFGVDGDIIDFRSGTVEVRIEVERPGERNGWGGAAGEAGSAGLAN